MLALMNNVFICFSDSLVVFSESPAPLNDSGSTAANDQKNERSVLAIGQMCQNLEGL